MRSNSVNFGAYRRGGKRLVFSRRSSVECSARLTKRWAVDGRVDGASSANGAGRGAGGGAHLSPPRVRARSRSARKPACPSAVACAISVIRVHGTPRTYPISMDRLMIMDVNDCYVVELLVFVLTSRDSLFLLFLR